MSEDPTSTADLYWRHLGVPSAARRALIHAGIYNLDAYAGFDPQEIAQLHGMGPKALGILSTALAELAEHREKL
jgi:hypothetical protein